MKLRVDRQFFKLVGATTRTYDEQNNLVCRADQKAFKLKEEVIFYKDEAKMMPYFNVNARKIIDLGMTYDITDSATGQLVASLRRMGIMSAFVRDEWLILNANEQEIGRIVEESAGLGFLRRQFPLVAVFLPQRFAISINGQEYGTMQQNRNPFTLKLYCTYADNINSLLGTLLPIAIPSLIEMIEARQN